MKSVAFMIIVVNFMFINNSNCKIMDIYDIENNAIESMDIDMKMPFGFKILMRSPDLTDMIKMTEKSGCPVNSDCQFCQMTNTTNKKWISAVRDNQDLYFIANRNVCVSACPSNQMDTECKAITGQRGECVPRFRKLMLLSYTKEMNKLIVKSFHLPHGCTCLVH
ncbi:unnamed protein product [Brassicogethes aeneus]|uniref:Spaetzle domain-containing protein n=1 Tax=Brassicogethes aeneus TaxID=1431903 RepID=A0A9P0FGS0_BRAAE|nr:unnamed protein product [Brassicogethes aeneus]